MRIEYDWRKMFTRQRILYLDASVDGRREEICLKEGVMTVDDTVWAAISARADVQSMIEGRAIVELDPRSTDESIEVSDSTAPTPKTRTERKAELENANNQTLATHARRHGIKKPASGDWKEVIPEILFAEFGDES